MARNYYSEINLHITWHVKESARLLAPKVEAIVHRYLRGKCINTVLDDMAEAEPREEP